MVNYNSRIRANDRMTHLVLNGYPRKYSAFPSGSQSPFFRMLLQSIRDL